jgi:hypothetical protein
MWRLNGAARSVSKVHMTLVSKHLTCMPRMAECQIVPCRVEHPAWYGTAMQEGGLSGTGEKEKKEKKIGTKETGKGAS